MPTITIRGIDELERKLGKVAAQKALEEPMLQSVLLLERRMKEYPPPPRPGEWYSKASPAQRRAFFALLNAGLISGSRTGTLGRRWTHSVTRMFGELVGRASNNTKYAPFVQDRRRQARFHQGRWTTAQQVVSKERRRIVGFFERAIRGGVAVNKFAYIVFTNYDMVIMRAMFNTRAEAERYINTVDWDNTVDGYLFIEKCPTVEYTLSSLNDEQRGELLAKRRDTMKAQSLRDYREWHRLLTNEEIRLIHEHDQRKFKGAWQGLRDAWRELWGGA